MSRWFPFLLLLVGCAAHQPAAATSHLHRVECVFPEVVTQPPCSLTPCLWDDRGRFGAWASDAELCPPRARLGCKAQFRDSVSGAYVSVPWPYCTVDGSHVPLPEWQMGAQGELRGDGLHR